ncbi:restriction endonuclease subunit S [Rhizobium sp. Leaf341]|uniref:restriction endonuclease subunit S n=1 Tax=Rhizobium sp. Leaf341 TaxID=1736344 RepID=UPI0007162DE9|nr:restriction endonuclease subunit S [Rhizobium sp. Leaf341]KQR79271.1 hypothetical protein ASG03_12025 [Rhizobium sp. Leaf341]
MKRAWSTLSLGEVSVIVSGFAFKSSGFNTDGKGLPLVRIRDVVRGYTDTFFEGNYDGDFVVENGDILIGMDGEFNRAKWQGNASLLNQRVCKIFGKPGQLDNNYLFHFLPSALKTIEDRTPFVTVKHLSVKDLRAIKLDLPPLDEQKRIAAILDKADQLRHKRRKAIALLDSLTQSIFLEMFGDPDENPKKLPIVDFGSLIVSGPTNGLYKPANAYGSGVRILRINNFYDGAVVELDKLRRLEISQKEQQAYGLSENDLVINRVNSREYLGKSALIPKLEEPVVFESNMMRLSLDQDIISSKYCIDLLQSSSIKQQISMKAKDAVNQSSINQTDVKSLKIMLPSLSKQREYASLALENAERKGRLQDAVVKSDGLFASLQHRAFSGQL